MLLSYSCNILYSCCSPEREMGGLHSIAQQGNEHLTKKLGVLAVAPAQATCQLEVTLPARQECSVRNCVLSEKPWLFCEVTCETACSGTERGFLAGGRVESHAFLPVFLKI